MDESMYDKIPGLDDWLKNLDFEDLSSSERELVMKYLGKDEYEEMREIIKRSSLFFAKESAVLAPDPEIKDELLSRFNQFHQSAQPVSRPWGIFHYKIPVYQALLAALFLVFLALYLGNFRSKKSGTIQYVSKVDTIYLERENQTPATVNSPGRQEQSQVPANFVNNVVPARKENAVRNKGLPDTYSAQLLNVEHLVKLSDKAKQGRNALDDSLLMKLLVTAN